MTAARAADLVRVAALGLRTRRLRAALSGLGIAIGIASMVAVLGVSESSRAELVAKLDALGSDLLSVRPGQALGGGDAELPATAPAMLGAVDGVAAAAGVSRLDASVRRSRHVPPEATGGLTVQVAGGGLLQVLRGRMAAGRWLSAVDRRHAGVVLGAVAARRLGVTQPGGLVWIAGRSFLVVGILAGLELAPEIDRSALIAPGAAARRIDREAAPTTVYVRAEPDEVAAVAERAGRTAHPERPEEVEVSNPSDALEARLAATGAFTSLFLGLGAVALLVGGVGVANVMIVGVLERRREVGLRRALGARRRDICAQFLGESLLLAGLGGAAGVALGALLTVAYAATQRWEAVLPAHVLAGGLAAAALIGGLAGLYPALRAARLSPTDALRTA